MRSTKSYLGVLTGCLVGAGFYACSASSGKDSEGQLFTSNGGQANGSSTDASLNQSGFANGAGGGGTLMLGNGGNGASAAPGTDGGCPRITQRPETVIVYKDATVTDTIYESKPVALFIMVDRSGSMVTGFPPPASADSWKNATTAITAFVQDPRTAGIDIGLGEFPAGQNNTADCTGGTDCGNAVVPIAPLPGNANAMVQAMQSQAPSSPIALTPTECGLRGMINQCLTYKQNSTTGEQCVAILITDGTPTQCDTNQANLVQIVAQGHAAGITTYTLGLPGADANFLNQLAQAGGTTASIDVSGGSQQFIDALNNIRQTVAVTTSTQQTTQTTISSPLPCAWGIPQVPPPATFNKDKVNVEFTPPGGGAPIQF